MGYEYIVVDYDSSQTFFTYSRCISQTIVYLGKLSILYNRNFVLRKFQTKKKTKCEIKFCHKINMNLNLVIRLLCTTMARFEPPSQRREE